MLVKSVAEEFEGKVRCVDENFGESELAERFGVKRYPAVFVNDVLVAKPKDFGFFGETGAQGAGRYTPWLNADNQARFRDDMLRLVGQAVRGELTSEHGVTAGEAQLARMPDFDLTDLDGVDVSSDSLKRGITVVEFWASWCPPCIKALPWLNDLSLAFPEDVRLVSIAVESTENDMRELARKHELRFPVVMGTPELARSFGDLVAVPTMFVFDRGGELAEVFYGAPPGMYDRVEALIERLRAE